jgi:hypothetical protein
MRRPSLEELRQLSVEDRLRLAQDIWTTFEEELNRRLKAIEENGSQGMEWDEFHKCLREQWAATAAEAASRRHLRFGSTRGAPLVDDMQKGAGDVASAQAVRGHRFPIRVCHA